MRDLAMKPENVEAGFPMNTVDVIATVKSPPIQLASSGIPCNTHKPTYKVKI